MSTMVEIPSDVQPFIKQAIASGGYANEQEVVSEILRLAAPLLEEYRRLRAMVKQSEAEGAVGLDVDADFDEVRQHLRDAYNELGQRK